MVPGLFITGTDTGVGKTWVASAIVRAMTARGLRVGVMKPVATGVTRRGGRDHCEDAEALIAASGRDVPIARACPIRFEPPMAPPIAARLGGDRLDFPRVLAAVNEALAWWHRQDVDVMVVEGVGGLLCPIAEGALVCHLAQTIDYPLVIVARRGLGTLNHTLMTVHLARAQFMPIAGVVLNAAEPEDDFGRLLARTNHEWLARDGAASAWEPPVKVLADVEHHPEGLPLPEAIEGVNWFEQADRPREKASLRRGLGPR
jgi:dethiobiotin synthetase